MSPRVRYAADGAEVRSESLPRKVASAPVGRRLVRRALQDWDLGDLVEDAETVVTELIANAAQHARYDTVRLSVRRTERGGVRVAVTDRSRAEPVLCCPGPSAEGGRGMAIIDALSVRWGHVPLPWGKSVWAEVEAAER